MSNYYNQKGILTYVFSLNTDLLVPTTRNRAVYTVLNAGVGSVIQQKSFTINSAWNDLNKALVNNINWNNAWVLNYNQNQVHRYVNMTLPQFEDFIRQFHFPNSCPSGSLNQTDARQYVRENIARYNNVVSVIDMRYQAGEIRLNSEHNISNLLQGRSEGKQPGEPDYYYGDRYLPEMVDSISLQIHHVKIRKDTQYYNAGDEIIMLALCMPKDFTYQKVIARRNL